jgi:hypothetical protein
MRNKLILVVGYARVELATNGLKVRVVMPHERLRIIQKLDLSIEIDLLLKSI